MAMATLHARNPAISSTASPFPSLLHTPTGLAILELQGTINLPSTESSEDQLRAPPIGRFTFPDYRADSVSESTAWMKHVYFFVGQHQRLTGEVKKLPRPIAVIRRRERHHLTNAGQLGEELPDELQVVEIVRYKLVFSQRPEPVGTET
jgi:chromosome transmission fidelity protein 8